MPASSVSSTVVCIGVACHDTIAVAAGAVVPDGRIVASEIVEAGGGNAATAAVALARLGIGVSFIGRVGRDETGERIGAGLAGEGVDVAGLKGTEGRTGRSVIIVNPETGQRSIVTYSGAAVTMTLTVDELEACAAAEWVHVDQTGFRVVRQLREAGIRTPVSLDGGTVVAGLDLGLVDMYAPTRNELLRTMGTGDLEEALGRALAAGPRMVAVTCGEEGSVGAVRGEVFRVPAFAPPVMVSTLGAGDVFHGALLAGLVEGMGVGDALRYANGAAALACRAMDGRSGIPGRGELRGFVGLDF